MPTWARPGSDEPPPWARAESGQSESGQSFQIPFYVYLLASAITAIAAVRSRNHKFRTRLCLIFLGFCFWWEIFDFHLCFSTKSLFKHSFIMHCLCFSFLPFCFFMGDFRFRFCFHHHILNPNTALLCTVCVQFSGFLVLMEDFWWVGADWLCFWVCESKACFWGCELRQYFLCSIAWLLRIYRHTHFCKLFLVWFASVICYAYMRIVTLVKQFGWIKKMKKIWVLDEIMTLLERESWICLMDSVSIAMISIIWRFSQSSFSFWWWELLKKKNLQSKIWIMKIKSN